MNNNNKETKLIEQVLPILNLMSETLDSIKEQSDDIIDSVLKLHNRVLDIEDKAFPEEDEQYLSFLCDDGVSREAEEISDSWDEEDDWYDGDKLRDVIEELKSEEEREGSKDG